MFPVLAVNTDNMDFRENNSGFEGLVEAILSHSGGLQGYNPATGGGLRI